MMLLRKTAAMEWEVFRARVISPDAPRAAVTELRRVFYAGMSSGVELAVDRDDPAALFEEIRRTVLADVVTGAAWEE